MRRRVQTVRGFTLVEVLVALAVLTIALAAVLRAMGQAIDITTSLRDRTVALWVAEERATERLLLAQIQRQWADLGTTEGKMEFGDREWRWSERVTTTPFPLLRRIDIEIRGPKSADVLGRASLFLRRPS